MSFIEHKFTEQGYSVKQNNPFSGGYLTKYYGTQIKNCQVPRDLCYTMDREVICMPFILTENRIAYVQEGQLLAEATFPEFAPGVVNIDHTFVDEALRGQGVAAQMMERIARSLRETGRKAIPTCSYAKKWFGQHPEYADVLR